MNCRKKEASFTLNGFENFACFCNFFLIILLSVFLPLVLGVQSSFLREAEERVGKDTREMCLGRPLAFVFRCTKPKFSIVYM